MSDQPTEIRQFTFSSHNRLRPVNTSDTLESFTNHLAQHYPARLPDFGIIETYTSIDDAYMVVARIAPYVLVVSMANLDEYIGFMRAYGALQPVLPSVFMPEVKPVSNMTTVAIPDQTMRKLRNRLGGYTPAN